MFLFVIIFVLVVLIFIMFFIVFLLIIFIIVFLIIMNILVYYRSWDTWGTTISFFTTRSNWSYASWLSSITFNSRCSGCAFCSCFTDRSSASWNSWFSRNTTRSHWSHRTDNRLSRGPSFSFASWDSRLSWLSWAWDWDFNVEDFF